MFRVLTQEQQMIRDTARRFAREEVAPTAKAMDQTGEFPYALMQRCTELGFTAMLIPQEYGGMGLGLTEFCLVMEEISRESQTLGIVLDASVTLGFLPILNFGSAAQKQKYLPMCVAGKIGAIAATEPAGTWNIPAWTTKAERQGDDVVINGTKMFVTNSQAADIYQAMCCIGDDPTPRLIIVEKGTPGLSFGNIEKKLGWNGSNTGTVHFDNVRVPASNVVMLETMLAPFFYESCVAIGAMCVGAAAGALKQSLEYVKQRHVLGQHVIEHQSVKDSIARAAMDIEAARMMVYQTAALMDAGQAPAAGSPISFMASACKIKAPEMASQVCDLAIQLHGGFGYMNDTGINRYWRDVRACQIGEGPTSHHLTFMADVLLNHDLI